MRLYNLDKLIKISVNDFYEARNYIYKKEIKFLGFTVQKEGFYCTFFTTDYHGKQVPENHILKDGVVYEKPEVVLFFQDNFRKVFYFETFEEAKKYAEGVAYQTESQFIKTT